MNLFLLNIISRLLSQASVKKFAEMGVNNIEELCKKKPKEFDKK